MKMARRRFTVYTEPHVADPAWIAPVVELIGEEQKYHENADELAKTAWEMQFEIGRRSGMVEENVRVSKYLKTLGWDAAQLKKLHFWRG
jgi:hypothetical protein